MRNIPSNREVSAACYRITSPYFCVEGGTIPFILKYSTICHNDRLCHTAATASQRVFGPA